MLTTTGTTMTCSGLTSGTSGVNRSRTPSSGGWRARAIRFGFGTRRSSNNHSSRNSPDLPCEPDNDETQQRQSRQVQRQYLEETRRRILRQLEELEALEAQLRQEQKKEELYIKRVDELLTQGEQELANPNDLVDPPTCAICLEDYETSDCCVQGANCLHKFHKECIRSVLCKTTACPLCRQDFLPKDEAC